jgi:hypothetical protein
MLLWGLKGSWTLEVGAAPLAFSKLGLLKALPQSSALRETLQTR